MIKSFKSRPLKALHEQNDPKRVQPGHVKKLKDILSVLHLCNDLSDVNVPGLRLHSLRGKLRDHYAIEVSGNWRVTFRFEDGDVADVDYLDYH